MYKRFKLRARRPFSLVELFITSGTGTKTNRTPANKLNKNVHPHHRRRTRPDEQQQPPVQTEKHPRAQAGWQNDENPRKHNVSAILYGLYSMRFYAINFYLRSRKVWYAYRWRQVTGGEQYGSGNRDWCTNFWIFVQVLCTVQKSLTLGISNGIVFSKWPVNWTDIISSGQWCHLWSSHVLVNSMGAVASWH